MIAIYKKTMYTGLAVTVTTALLQIVSNGKTSTF